MEKNQPFRLYSGPQGEATHSHSIYALPARSQHHQGDPHAGGSPGNWPGRNGRGTYTLGITMRLRIPTQHVPRVTQTPTKQVANG
eukprot:7274273-Pyramimonas_sp.AAC.1